MLPRIVEEKLTINPALSCKAIKCIKAKAAKTNGKTKCKAKNLFKVALFTEHKSW